VWDGADVATMIGVLVSIDKWGVFVTIIVTLATCEMSSDNDFQCDTFVPLTMVGDVILSSH
jgi:glycerol-3-phosphate acyltransferase PlsY